MTWVSGFLCHCVRSRTYSTSEVACGTWIDGSVIYQRTWEIADGANGQVALTGLTTALVGTIVDAIQRRVFTSNSGWYPSNVGGLVPAGGTYEYTRGAAYTNASVTVWYTKA